MDANQIIAEWLTRNNRGELAYAEDRWECGNGHPVNDDGHCEGPDCESDTARFVPRDFTNATYLFLAVEAYCDVAQCDWYLGRRRGNTAWAAIYTAWWRVEGSEDLPSHALRSALVAAMEAEKGETL
jgi:hypothetical protein